MPGGNRDALDALLPLVYKELRRVAHFQLRNERPNHTLQSAALVHEAYLRLVGMALSGRAALISSPLPPSLCARFLSTMRAATGRPNAAPASPSSP